jgi:TetR/AcrR family transcriptional repressor of lmrAB and yxaGH operons
MTDARNRIIETTSRLLEEQGYHATGLSQIVEESGAPRGSLYYYFPEGKEEISEAALRRTGRQVSSAIRGRMEEAASASAGVRALMTTIGERMEATGYRAGGPITTVALESAPDKSRLTRACREIYTDWRRLFRERIAQDGVSEDRADRLAGTVLAAIEGAMVLARTYQRRQPLDEAADALVELIERAP